MKLDSKYDFGNNVHFSFGPTSMVGFVVGIHFTERGEFYDIETSQGLFKGVNKKDITGKITAK